MGLPKMLSSGSALLVAPMAGGPSTPALVVNAWRAGHFAQLAAGYKTVAAMSDEIAQVRAAQVSVFGVNLFVPSRVSISDGAYRAYADRLRGIALDLGQELPPLREDEDLWAEKIDALIADPVPVVSFTFGLPGEDVFRRLRKAGTYTLQTVTSWEEVSAAWDAGARGVTLQAAAAGGHSAAWRGDAAPKDVPLTDLIRQVRAGWPRRGVIATGGVSKPHQMRDALSAGADAVAVGTAVLLADEAGTSAVHRAALVDPRFDQTVLTRAFTGRYARALANDFTRKFSDIAPAGYPALHHLTRGIRSAAAAAGDASRVHLWAGEGWRDARRGPVADVLSKLST